MDRPSAYKWPPAPFRRTTPPFAPSPCPTPSPLPHTPPSRRNRCLAVSAARGIPRRAAAPQEVDDRFAAVPPSFLSVLHSPASPCSAAAAAHVLHRFIHRNAAGARSHRSGPAGASTIATDDSLHPATCNAARDCPRASTADSSPHRRPEPALGEPIIHHRAAGAVAPPDLGRRDPFEPGPLDLDPTVAYRFDFIQIGLKPKPKVVLDL